MSKIKSKIFLYILIFFAFAMLPKLVVAWTDIDEPIYVDYFYDNLAPAEDQIGNPYGIAVDDLGRIFVVDQGDDRIIIFSSTGEHIKTFGQWGNLDGEFNSPEGIFIKGQYAYIADVSNHRIQVFDMEGNFVRKFGSYGSAPGQLNSPYGVYVDSSDLVYVSEGNNNRISVFDTNGNFVKIGTTLSSKAEDVVRDESGNFYVATGSNNVRKYDSNFTYIKSFGSNFDDIHYKDGVIYAIKSGVLYLYNQEGVLIRTFGTNDVRNTDGIPNVLSIWVDNNNKIYILLGSQQFKVYQIDITQIDEITKEYNFTFLWAKKQYDANTIDAISAFFIDDGGNYYIGGCAIPSTSLYTICGSTFQSVILEKYDQNKNLIFRINKKGSLDGEFLKITDIIVDKKGNILVVDSSNNRVAILNSNGEWIGYLGTFGTEVGQFKTPYTITKDSSGNLYVLDYGNNRIQKFDENYQFLLSFPRPASYTYSIDIYDEKIYLSDVLNNNTYVFDLNGSLLKTYGNGVSYYPNVSILNGAQIVTFPQTLMYTGGDYNYPKLFSTTDNYTQSSSWRNKDGILRYRFAFSMSNADVKIKDSYLYLASTAQKNILIYKFDRIGPELEIEKLNDDKLYSNNKTLSGSLSDELTAITSVEFKVGDNDWNSCTSDDGAFDQTSEQFVCDISNFISSEGAYQLSIRAIDSRTNTTVESFEYIYDLTNVKPVITQIGLIKNIPNKDSLYYYFTANKVRIYGTSESNSTVQFERVNGTKYTTQADSEGKFLIVIDLPNGETKLTYSSTDLAGNVSGSRTITLNIDPSYGTNTEGTQEETVTTDEEETVDEETIEQKETRVVKSLLVVDSDGNILSNKTIVIEGKEYKTDERGYIHTDQGFTSDLIASIEGRNYTIKPSSTYLTLTEADEDGKNINVWYYIVPIIVLLIVLGGAVIYKKR